MRRAREALEAILPARLHRFVTDALWERALIALSAGLVVAWGAVDDWSFFQQLVGAAATLFLVTQVSRFASWVLRRLRGPLELTLESQALMLRPFNAEVHGASVGSLGLADLLIINHEPRRVLLRLTVQSDVLGEIRGISQCISPGVVVDGNPQPHLRTEIPLERGQHARGCAEFLIWDQAAFDLTARSSMSELAIVVTDLLSGRSRHLVR